MPSQERPSVDDSNNMKNKPTTSFTISVRTPKAAVETVRGLLGWACQEFWLADGDVAAQTDITVELYIAPGTDAATYCRSSARVVRSCLAPVLPFQRHQEV